MEVKTLLQTTYLLCTHSDTKIKFLFNLDFNQALDKANDSNMMQTPIHFLMNDTGNGNKKHNNLKLRKERVAQM